MEKMSRKALHEGIKAKYFEEIKKCFRNLGFEDRDILETGSAEISLPVLDAERNEEWLVVTLKVPTGSRTETKGVTEPYDGYAIAESLKLKRAQDAEKARAKAEAKARKIERDAKARAEKKAAREAAKAEKEEE